MNILHVVNISFVIPYFLGRQLNYFVNKGNKEFVMCSPSDELDTFGKDYSFDYKAVDVLRSISINKDIKAVCHAVKYIREKRIDIVVGHTPKGALIAMLASYLCKVPKRIYLRHGLVYETSKGFKRKLLIAIDRLAAKLATKIVCVSDSVAKRSVGDGLNSASKQVVLSKGTCNGIDTERFNYMNLDDKRIMSKKNELKLKYSDFVIGFTGRMVKDKGIIELIKAFDILRKKYENIKLLLVGMLETRDALPADVVELIKNNPNVVTTGYVQNSIIEYYYSLMDVFVLPSYREGFPTSVLEASSMNLPIVTTRVTGCIDSIIENETGIFVEHTPESLAQAIEKLYLSFDLRKKMGENGRKFVVDYYRQEIIWNEIEKLYLE